MPFLSALSNARRSAGSLSSGLDPWAVPWHIDSAARTRVGKAERRNQDHVKASDVLSFFSVADGIGGLASGEHASFLAVEAIHEYLLHLRQQGLAPTAELVREAFEAVNEVILDEARRDSGGGMGSVLTSLLFAEQRFWVGHVGSGRAWRVRGGEARRLTMDHTLAGEQERNGVISAAQARLHPFRKVLSRSLGRRDRVAVDVVDGSVRRGDVFVLATDGILAAVDDDAVGRVVGASHRAGEVAWELTERALETPTGDDITVLVVACC